MQFYVKFIARCVIIKLPTSNKKEEMQRLNVLLKGSASVITEPSNIVDKMEDGIESGIQYYLYAHE